MQDLVKRALYQIPSDQVNTPDIEQAAAYLHQELQIKKLSLEEFTNKYINFLSEKEILSTCIYDQVIDQLLFLRESFQKERKLDLLFLSWTQGNLFLQSQKAKIFQELVPKESLANPSIYAALNKIQILNTLVKDLKRQGFNYFILIDDRSKNLSQATEILKQQNLIESYLILHKIRPDKPNKNETHSIRSIESLREINKLFFQNNNKDLQETKIALVLDKDGVIFNTTKYRKILESSIPEFLRKIC